jgi:hypothetical protein
MREKKMQLDSAGPPFRLSSPLLHPPCGVLTGRRESDPVEQERNQIKPKLKRYHVLLVFAFTGSFPAISLAEAGKNPPAFEARFCQVYTPWGIDKFEISSL